MGWRTPDAPSPWRLGADTLRAAPLGLALPLLIAAVEALERRDPSALLPIALRALDEVGPLVPLIAAVAALAGARARGAWTAWSLLGWSPPRLLLPIAAAGGLLALALAAALAAAPPPPSPPSPRAVLTDDGRWRVQRDAAAWLLDPARLQATPAPHLAAPAPPPLQGRASWLARALALLGLLPLWALPARDAARPSLASALLRLVVLGGGWLLAWTLLALLVQAQALPPALALAALLIAPLAAGGWALRRVTPPGA